MVPGFPVELLPNRRDFPIILKVSQRVMPVARNRDFFAEEPAAVLKTAFADDRLQARETEISAEGEIVLSRTDENDIPFLIDMHKNQKKAT